MSFDGPDQILPIFHHLMSFDGPKNLMSFDGPKPRFSPFKISCLLMDPICTYIFKVFPSKTSCLLMDPFLDSNLVSFDGPKPHVFQWTLDDFLGPSKDMRFLGPPEDMSTQKTHVF